MNFRAFKHNYHDGQLLRFTLGPRRELTLEVDLNPVWNGQAIAVSIRLGGIDNFDEVRSFLQSLPKPQRSDAYIAALIGLDYVAKRANWVAIDFVGHGCLIVHAQHVSEL